MRIVNCVSLYLLKNILKKYYLFNNVDYSFVESEDDLIEEVKHSRPEIIILEHDIISKSKDKKLEDIIDLCEDDSNATRLVIINDSDKNEDLRRVEPWVNFVRLETILHELPKIILDVTASIESEQKKLINMEKKNTILFVDDSQLMHMTVESAFENTKYNVLHAVNGLDGYRQFVKYHPSMVITDLVMPELNGDELCHRIKKDPIGKHIPVIILTANHDTSSIEEAYNYGANDFLVKPLSKESLVNKVNEYFVNRANRRQEKILIVDDSMMIREIIRHAVLKTGMTPLTAPDGVEALKIILEESPDVVITDINMPNLDGYGLVKAIRNTPSIKDQNVIMMSTQHDPYDIKKGEELGISRYFMKPFDVDKLLMEIEHILIENYRVYKKEYDYMLYTIHSLVQALEERDAYTRGHTDRVTTLSVNLAKHIKLDQKEVEKIKIAANLHDIGKIGVRDSILLKPGSLNDEEYLKIQKHTIKGVEILKPIESLKDILPLILLHHEKWNGEGYPTAIHGDEIPIGARIIAVSDSYDAMTSNRPYRDSMPHEKALEIIQSQSGVQFCPVCASAFIDMMNDRSCLSDV